MAELYPYQREGAHFLAQRQAGLLAHDMGAGKSIMAIAALDEIDAATALVVCPAVVRVNWQRELARWQSVPRTIGTLSDGADVTVVSYEQATQYKDELPPVDVLICDESHYAKSARAKRTQALYGKNGLADRAGRVWLLSGTPMPNNPSEIWPHLYRLAPMLIRSDDGKVMNYHHFTNKYCVSRETRFGRQIIGARNSADLKQRLSTFMLRRTVTEVLQDLPPIRWSTVTVEGPAVSQAPHVDPENLKETPELATLRREVGLAKVRAAVDLLTDELVADQHKVVVFAHHRDVLDGLESGLHDFSLLRIDGSTAPGARQKAIDDFQFDSNRRVFLGQLTAAGTGITLHAASDVMIVEPSWVPAENAQAAKRCHRIGQCHPVFVRQIALADSLDEAIAAVLLRKVKMLSGVGL